MSRLTITEQGCLKPFLIKSWLIQVRENEGIRGKSQQHKEANFKDGPRADASLHASPLRKELKLKHIP